MFWENLAEFEFEDAIKKCGGVCVLPLGCLEKHGQHLPMGTDTFIANDVAAMAAEMEDVMIFPTAMWLGDVSCFKLVDPPESQRMRGCIALSPELLLMTLEELCDEISRNGFKKILILNAHGGNTPLLNYFLRAQAYKKKDYATMWTWAQDTATCNTRPKNLLRIITERKEDFPMITEEDIKVIEGYVAKNPNDWGGHGDMGETSLVMATRPETVHVDMIDAEFSGLTGRWTGIPRLNLANEWYGYSPACYGSGPPHGCSSTIGQAIMKINAEEMAEMFKKLKEKDFDCVRIANMQPPLEP